MSVLLLSELPQYVQGVEPKQDTEQHVAAKLGGAIAAGILVGAVAAFLVGGLIGSSETTTGVASVGHYISAP